MSDREGELSSLISSAGLVTVGAIVSSFALLVERIIIGRVLTVEAYGEVSIGISLLAIGVTISLVGFSQGIPRYMARYDRRADKRGVWIAGLGIAGGVSLCAVLILYPNAETISSLFFEDVESVRMVRMFVLAIPLVVGLEVGIAAIRGLENTIYKVLVQDLFYPIFRIGLLFGLLLGGLELTAPAIAYIAAASLSVVLAHALLQRLLSLVGQFRTSARELLTFSLPLVFATIFASLLTKVDTFMLGYFRSSFEVGLYSAAYPLAQGMLVVLGAFGFLYLPLASRLDADGEREEVDAIYKVTTKWIYIITFPALLAFVAFPADVLEIFFGADYRAGAIALVVLSLGFFTNAAYGRNRETLSALGYPRYILAGNLAALVLNIALNLILIPAYGVVGAAVTSAVSFLSFNLLIYVILVQKFDISPFSHWSVRTAVLLPVVLGPPALLLSAAVSLSPITLVLFLGTAGIASLTVVCLTGCLEPDDRVAIDLVEDIVGIRVPLIRRFLPGSH